MRVTEKTSCLCVCLCLPCQANARLCDVVRTKELGCCPSALHNSHNEFTRAERPSSVVASDSNTWVVRHTWRRGHDGLSTAPTPLCGEFTSSNFRTWGRVQTTPFFSGVIRTVRKVHSQVTFQNFWPTCNSHSTPLPRHKASHSIVRLSQGLGRPGNRVATHTCIQSCSLGGPPSVLASYLCEAEYCASGLWCTSHTATVRQAAGLRTT